MNGRYLKNAKVWAQIMHIWTSSRSGGFFRKLRKVVKYYKEFCLRTTKTFRKVEAHLRSELSEAVEALQADPANPSRQSHLNDIDEHLEEVENGHIEGLKT